MMFARVDPKFWSVAFYGCGVAVLVIASMPLNQLVPGTGWDKTDHVIAFLVLGLLGKRAHPSAQTRCYFGLLGFGLAIELLQAILPHRTAELSDLFADGVGLSLALGLSVLAQRGISVTNAQITARLLMLPRSVKQALTIAMDAGICLFVVWLAFGLRLGTWDEFGSAHWWTAAWAIGLSLPVFYVSGLYRALLRHDSGALLARSSLTFGAIFMVLFTVIGSGIMPRALGVLVPVTLYLTTSAARSAGRYWLGFSRGASRRGQCAKRHILIYGAGDAGRQVAALLATTRDMVVRGFIDDSPALHGATLKGLPIHSSQNLRQTIVQDGITDVLLAMPSVRHSRRVEIVCALQALGVPLHVRTLPDLHEIARGRVQVDHLRKLEIEDLLGRDCVRPDEKLLRSKIAGKVVLVTGAGGSIGGELCRQIVRLGPTALILLEVSEYALYAIHQKLEAEVKRQPIKLLPVLGSVRDTEHVRHVLAHHTPDTIYHAAAYKHVPMVEHNPVEGIQNNTFGTLTIALLAREFQVPDFVLISTDKAVRPTSVMGASKRLAEMVLQALAAEGGKTCFSMVRFGNVLGSSGSVVPLFKRQIAAGGPITITHPAITRYFMTIPEAVQLVLQASAMATGGEVFLLDMGKPVKVVDLARKMVELSGMTIKDSDNPNGDIELVVTGLRPGEKLFEELLIGDNPMPTAHPRVMKGQESFPSWNTLRAQLGKLERSVLTGDVQTIRRSLQLTVPGYAQPSSAADASTSSAGARDAAKPVVAAVDFDPRLLSTGVQLTSKTLDGERLSESSFDLSSVHP